VVLVERLLALDLIVLEHLELALVVLVGDLLVLLNDLLHRDLASGQDVVRRSDVHDPIAGLASSSPVLTLNACSSVKILTAPYHFRQK